MKLVPSRVNSVRALILGCALLGLLVVGGFVVSGAGALELERYEAGVDPAQVTVLPRAHAHNDNYHARPLFDALDRGFMFIEVPVFQSGDTFLVAHREEQVDPARTLRGLYLDPLRARIDSLDGEVYPGNEHQFWLMIDMKTNGEQAWPVLHETLAEYEDILAVVRDGEVEPGPVRVTLSGDRPIELMRDTQPLYAGVDGRLVNLGQDEPVWLMPWISDRWWNFFEWDGTGEMPAEEHEKLARMVERVQGEGRMLRFYHTPEEEALWEILLDLDVDIITTDNLDKLQGFMLEHAER